MWDGERYCWVVICKNKWLHRRESLAHGHRIPLGETDAFSPPPPFGDSLKVRCDGCGKEYSYAQKDVMRFEMDLPEAFAPHPLFRAQ